MAARRSSPKAPAPPKPWRRESGVYVSVDDRFTIESGGAGRWFLTDGESLDELGLARTIGPFETLDEAKGAAADRRGQGTDASPLAERLAAAKGRPTPATRAPAKRAPRGHASEGQHEPKPVPEAEPEPAPAPEPARTWLDELADADSDAARAARRTIDALARLGVEDADALVRRDVLGRQPAVAARLLGRSLAAAIRERLDPAALARDARTSIPGPMRALGTADEEALAAYATFVAARILEATLEVVSVAEKAHDTGADLSGWRLVERPGAHDTVSRLPRRLIVTPEDVTGN